MSGTPEKRPNEIAAPVEGPAAPSHTPSSTVDDRPYLLERVGEAAVVQLYADGFDDLPLKEKTLIWHLYQAALVGRDIYYDQRHACALQMRDTLEAILTHSSAVEPETRREIERYTKLFWLNSGPYNNLTARKFVLTCTPAAFAGAARAAQVAGARFPLRDGETLDGLIGRLSPHFFDLEVDPMVTVKTPPQGHDILTASANNLYDGVSMADLEGFIEEHPLNSRLVKRSGALREEVYRVGGRYSGHISAIVEHLEAAIPLAAEPMAAALRALVRSYTTGLASDLRAYDVTWVADRSSPVDTINGFVEVYMDARGIKGAWEGIVFYVNREKTAGIQLLAQHASWFEEHMPWDPQYRRDTVEGITANAIDVVFETGESGPLTPVGINLPNDEYVRERYGSKSVTLSNVSDAYERSTPAAFRTEFSWTAEEGARAVKWSAVSGDLHTNMHEVIGHASGKVSPELEGRPQTALREHYSTLEEARADLVALYFLPDPKLAELGIVPAADQEEIVRAEYEAYARQVLVQLRRVRHGTQLEEDHMRSRQLIIGWLMANTTAVRIRHRDGKTFCVMEDPAAFRAGVGTLLAEVQRIKSEGDSEAARQLVETYGVHFDGRLRDEIVARVETLGMPSYTGFVMPELQASRNALGEIADVAISYPLDLARQMLDYSAATRFLRQ
jgi:dipeptidyl-peptidase-3